MDAPTLNQYEQQLYSMFKSFDVNDEESLGSGAVHALCDALQLEERGEALVDSLFAKRAGRVTFERFRSGLLTVLGDPPRPPLPAPPDEGAGAGGSEEPAGEAEPHFVLGAKRYGRRSRPPAPRAASAERAAGPRAPPDPPRARSACAAPAPHHAARIDGQAALALCRDLRVDIDRRLVERIFEDSPTGDTTVGEFFERLDSTLAREVSGAGEQAARDDGAPLERLLDEWERAGVRRPRLLLAELGVGAAPPAAALEAALDAELRALPAAEDEAPRERLLAAALVLARAGRASAAARAEAAAAERDKLRADVAEANARSALLARDVDENHARLEREAKESLRRAVARSADEARRARAEAEAELERGAAERARLQAELARRADSEARRAAEAEALAARAAALEEGAAADAVALEAAREERARLQERLRAAEERACAADEEAARGAEARAALAELACELRRERERADELAAALARAPPSPPPPPRADANLSAEMDALLAPTEESCKDAQAADEAPAETTTGGGERDALADAEDECERLRELVKELESALEAMRGEYEACEEYWAGKQRSERAAHEAELRATDARLAALLARVRAFEGRLPPVPELPALEDQVAALEAEHAAEQRALAARLQRAHRRLAALQRRRAAGGEAGECARCRRGAAAAAAAEAAARRLQARLLAADLLVKELYVENCELARRAT